VISIDLNYGFRSQDLAVQLGVACVGQAPRFLQLRIRKAFLAKLCVCQPAEQISLDGKIASGGIGHARAIEQSDYVGSAALIGKDLGFEEAELHAPIRVASRKLLACLFCFLLRSGEITV
jgi:hypothetical protein